MQATNTEIQANSQADSEPYICTDKKKAGQTETDSETGKDTITET